MGAGGGMTAHRPIKSVGELVASGLVAPFSAPRPELSLSWDSVDSFLTAGLILLVSWIMDVGLHEKEHADELRRDADLVI